MGQARRAGVKPAFNEDKLYINLAEQLKLPFVTILHAAQSMEGVADAAQIERTISDIALSAEAALRLIDGYVLSAELQRLSELEMEPVSISSLLYDTAESLSGYAKAHGCALKLEVGGKFTPVMANKRAVAAALTSLGYSFIEAAMQTDDSKPVVKLAVRKNQNGISAGVFSNNQGLSSMLLNQARHLNGRARQPLAAFDSGTSAGVFIADALFNGLDTRLKVARSGSLQGLAATLLPSRQLNLV